MQQSKTSASASRQKQYARLRTQLARIGWISEGYVQERGPGALAIPGPAKSKARRCASPYPRSSMSGLSKPSPIGGPSRKPSARCSASAGRNSLTRYPVPSAERNSAKRFWDWFRTLAAPEAIQCHQQVASSKIGRPQKQEKHGIPEK